MTALHVARRLSPRVLACLLILSAPAAYAHGGGHDSGPSSLRPGGLSVEIENTYNMSKNVPDAKLAHLASRHVHAHTDDYSMTTAIRVAFGVSDRTTVSLSIPHIHRENVRSASHTHIGGGGVINRADSHGDAGGRGDMTALVSRRVLDTGSLSATLTAGLKMPTGDTGVRHRGETLEAEFQPGSGSWDPILGAALEKRCGNYILGAGVMYRMATEGIEDTDLGDSAAATLSIARPFGRWTPALSLDGEWTARKETAGAADRDSGGSELFVTPALRYAAASGWSARVAAGLPVARRLREGHAGTAFRLTTGIGRNF